MTAGARLFACTTDNKRACACQNRWWCVTVFTQCCLLLAWPSTPCHVSFHNQGEGKMGQRNHPAFLPVSSCCRFSAFPSHFLWFFACFDHLAGCLSLFLHLLFCGGIIALRFKEQLTSVCLLLLDNISVSLQNGIMKSVFLCYDWVSAKKEVYYFWMLSCQCSPTEKEKKERQNKQKKLATLKCTTKDRLLVSYAKNVKIKQNNAVPTFHANFYTTKTESTDDISYFITLIKTAQ